jgi:Zn-dependent protease
MSTPHRPAGPPVRVARMLRIGSVLGVPIFLTPSWLFVAAFITLSYSDFLRSQVAGLTAGRAHLLALGYAVALAASVLLHEVGHTVVSRLLGMQVRRIVVFLLGGVSEIEGESTRPRDEFLIAAAGPAVSFLLAAGCWAAGLVPAADSSLAVVLQLLSLSNLIIAVFNVLPGLPLDGGRLLQAVVWWLGRSRNRAVRVAAWSGRGVAVLLALSILIGSAVLTGDRPVDFSSVGASAMGFAVAAFLWLGATQSLRAADLSRRASGLHIRNFLRPAIYLPPGMPISEAVRHAAESRAAGIVVVDSTGRSRAIVREADVAAIEQVRRPWATLAEVSRPLEPGLVMADALAGEELLAAVRANPASEYLVVDAAGVSCGVLATVDLARALSGVRDGSRIGVGDNRRRP